MVLRTYSLPYGKKCIDVHINSEITLEQIVPRNIPVIRDCDLEITNAIRNAGEFAGLPLKIPSNMKIIITLNDKTRPVPNDVLLPPLLRELVQRGANKKNIRFLIATGTHSPMKPEEFVKIINENILNEYQFSSHDCDEDSNLVYKGNTKEGTQVFVNKLFDEADLTIVVGDIEPHHFAGFSGGVKSAAIGVCGRKTITQNHALLMDSKSCVGNFETNPLRQDIEEIGAIIGVDLALNAILNQKKEVLSVFFGNPFEVIRSGIAVIRKNLMIEVEKPFDIVISSAGGYPKDINLYQAQKALTHASLFVKRGGTVILAAACEDGVGSESYLDFMNGVTSNKQVIKKFENQGFFIGPHKAFQFASIAEKIEYYLFSEIEGIIMKKLLIPKIIDLDEFIKQKLSELPKTARGVILPFATASIPVTTGEPNEY
ncbi:MAG: nickel-dependent lactate racemase [Chloroflexi bacterium]|nr:nickel-dependent lactate racemase [Chloroflexota bacterium]